jgi:SH3-like domain-containing protein
MIGKVVLAVAGIAGALMLIPGDGTTGTAASSPRQSALATSPELASFLESAVEPKATAKTPDQVIAAIAAQPEPGSPTPVPGLKLPATTAPIDVASVAGTPVTPEIIHARSAVNIRSGPSTDNATLSVLQPDEPVKIVAREGGWAKIEMVGGSSGWVYSSYLGDNVAAPEEKPIREARAEPQNTGLEVSAGGAIRLRAGPSSMSETILRVEPGTPMQIAEQRDGWLRVVLPDGLSGWIRGRV